MQYHIGIDVDALHQIEVRVTDNALCCSSQQNVYTVGAGLFWQGTEWVSAAEYALEYVQACHPNTTVELAYVKEFDYD